MALERSQPVIGMKVNFPFQISACCWVDLLGYGSSIRQANYNPLHNDAKIAVKRIRTFHQVVANHSVNVFPTLIMNDGAIAYRDLSYRASWPTYDFLQRSKALFDAIQSEEQKSGWPGARMVIAPGFRLRGRGSQSNDIRGKYVKKIIDQLNQDKISIKEAITKASKFRRSFDIVPQLQANFAFTKAYVAEESGTAYGLPGPACYVDGLFFKEDFQSDANIQIGNEINWHHEDYNLSAKFRKLTGVRQAKQTEKVEGVVKQGGPKGLRNALEVAQILVGNPDVLSSLRLSQKERVEF